METNVISRRKTIGLLGLSVLNLNWVDEFKRSGFKIGACDWSLGKKDSPEVAQIAQLVGLHGAQINMGNPANNMWLRDPKIQKLYKETFKKHNVKISGLALGDLNSYPLKSDPRTEQWVADSVDVAVKLKVKNVLLAFFEKGDLKGDEEGTRVVIEKLKRVMPIAEKAGITFGIESWLNAKEHLYIIEQVASPNLKVYYDVANSNTMGYDIYQEILDLGKANQICEFHAKENGFVLGNGKVDFKKVKDCLLQIGYKGWLQIEGATPQNMTIENAYFENTKFLKNLLNIK